MARSPWTIIVPSGDESAAVLIAACQCNTIGENREENVLTSFTIICRGILLHAKQLVTVVCNTNTVN